MVNSENAQILNDEDLSVIVGGGHVDGGDFLKLLYEYLKRSLSTRTLRIMLAGELAGVSLVYLFYYLSFGKALEKNLQMTDRTNESIREKSAFIACEFFHRGMTILSVVVGADGGRKLAESFCKKNVIK